MSNHRNWFVMSTVSIVLCLTGTVFADFTDNFDYTNGPLAGKGSWQGTTGHANPYVSGNELILYGNKQIDTTYLTGLDVTGDNGVLPSVTVKVRQGSDLSSSGTNMWWRIELFNNLGNALGGWAGRDDSIFSYPASWASGTGIGNDLTGGADTVRAEIDFDAGEVDYYFNGAYSRTTTFTPSGSAVDKLQFRWDNDLFAGQYLYFESVQVAPEPATMALFVVGGLTIIRRKGKRTWISGKTV